MSFPILPSPFLGVNTVLIESQQDAYILAHLLAKGTSLSPSLPIARIAQVYDEIRCPAGNLVQSRSRMNGLYYEFNAPGFNDDEGPDPENININTMSGSLVREGGKEDKWPAERLERLGEAIVRDFRYAWESTSDSDRERALQMLQ